MAYNKRVWTNTGEEVTYEDFNRIEEGITNIEADLSNQKNETIPGTLANQISNIVTDLGNDTLTTDAQYVHGAINEHEEQINVLNNVNTACEVIRKLQNGTNVNIVCYGDSVTAGTDSENNTELADEQYRYPKILGDLLTNLTRVTNTVINKGIPGATSTELLNKFNDNVLSLNPDMVILMCGINDFGNNVTIDTYKNNLNNMINLCKSNNIAILLLTPTQLYSYASSIIFTQYINACIDVAKNNGVRCVNTNYIFDLMLNKGKCSQSYICPDHIHPRKELYKCIAQLIMKELFDVFVVKDDSWLPVVNTHFAFSSCYNIYSSKTQNFVDAYVISPSAPLECVIVPFFIEKDTNIYMLHSKNSNGGSTNVLIDNGALSKSIDYYSDTEDNNAITQIETITELGYHTLEIYGGLTTNGYASVQAVYLSKTN